VSERLRLGVLVDLSENVKDSFAKVSTLGLDNCQLCSWQPKLWTREVSDAVVAAVKSQGIEISTFWAGYTGPVVWDFLQGPATIGLVPPQYRQLRVAELKHAADFATWIGAPSIATHLGFIPEDPRDLQYAPVVEAVRDIANTCKDRGLDFLIETGQETPVTVLRIIEDVGAGNVGINLDPANLVLYGKANPVDALDVFGKYVKGMHAKDGLYPTNGRELGDETPLGKGKVNFPKLMARLKECGFKGPVTIEREISGDDQIRDIRESMELLTPLL
jgi:L-ribulose-5-phosphate 3-epimerase